MDTEAQELVERRFEQIRRGVTEAIRQEVEWLESHNFPIWVSENGGVVDASKSESKKKTG